MEAFGKATVTGSLSEPEDQVPGPETADQEDLSATASRQHVTNLFGGLRAEWLGPHLYDLYRGRRPETPGRAQPSRVLTRMRWRSGT